MIHPFSSVRGRIIVGFGFLVFILAAVAAGSAWQVHEHRSDTAAMEGHADTAFALQNGLVKVEAVASALQRYVIVGDETQVAGDESLIPEMRSDMAEAEENLAQALADAEMRGDSEQAATLYQLSAEADTLIAGVEMIIAMRQSGDVKTAAATLEVTVLPFREFEGRLEAAAETELQKVSALRSQADTTGEVALWALIISGTAGAALGLATSVFVARSIIKPLSSLEATATAVSEGDLEARAEATGPRELAHLGASLNQMTESLLDASKRRELEEALRESEALHRDLVETSQDLVWRCDAVGRWTFLNQACEKIYGYRVEEMLGKSFTEFMAPEVADRDMKEFARLMAGGEVCGYETTHISKSGDDIHMLFNARTLFDSAGREVGTQGTASDITERIRAEEALRQSEERLHTVVASTPIVMFALDRSGVFTLSEGKGLATLGLKPGQAVGQLVFDVYRDVPQILENIRRSFAGESFTSTVEVGDLVFESWQSPLRDQNGEVSGVIGVATDITERVRAEEAVRDSEERYRRLIDTAADIIFTVSLDGTIISLNPAFETITGWSRSEWVGKPFASLLHPDDLPTGMEGFRRTLEGGEPLAGEYRLLTKSGEFITADVRPRPLLADGTVVGLFGIAHDITERKRAEETIKHLAYHDALTDLPNRSLFQDRLTVALAQAHRKRQMLAVLFLDLDHFKVVNDTVGHGEGDKLLRHVAERLTGLVREGDSVARMGGDEFALLSTEIAHAEDAAHVAGRILERLRRPWVLHGQEFLVTTSIGIALYPSDGDDAESLLRNADTAMYRAKEQGRDNYQLYTPAMNARIVERLALESDLRRGLERGEFEVYYQPQVNVRTGQVVGVEALVRWHHPERGLVLPAEFIPVAEETGIIVPLGEWVLRAACAQNKVWQEAGLPLMRVAVNLSARQFQQRSLRDTVAQVLEETGLDPHWLQLEITEGVAMQDVDFTITMMQGLREMGVQIAIDDFGTGYSSLAYLKRFPIDAVKIDRSFVCDLMVDPNDAAIVTTVITMAHSLELSVIAEGVETEAQLAFLNQQQCDEMQGFLFSKPVPAAVLEKIVRPDGRKAPARTAVDSA